MTLPQSTQILRDLFYDSGQWASIRSIDQNAKVSHGRKDYYYPYFRVLHSDGDVRFHCCSISNKYYLAFWY